MLGLYYDPYKNGIEVLLVLSGILVYLIFVAWRRKPVFINGTMGKQLIQGTHLSDDDKNRYTYTRDGLYMYDLNFSSVRNFDSVDKSRQRKYIQQFIPHDSQSCDDRTLQS